MGGSEIKVNLFTGGEIRDKRVAGLKKHTCVCEEGRDRVALVFVIAVMAAHLRGKQVLWPNVCGDITMTLGRNLKVLK